MILSCRKRAEVSGGRGEAARGARGPEDGERVGLLGSRGSYFELRKKQLPLIRTLKIQRYDVRKVLNIKEKAKNRLLGGVLKSPELTPKAFFMHQTMTKITFPALG